MLLSDLPEFSRYKHCDFNDTACLLRTQARISSVRPPNDAIGFEQFRTNKSKIGLKCDCPAGCREIVNIITIFSHLRMQTTHFSFL